MSKSTWKIIEVVCHEKKKKYPLDEKGALKYKNSKKKMPAFKPNAPTTSQSSIPPHPFSIAIISNSPHNNNSNIKKDGKNNNLDIENPSNFLQLSPNQRDKNSSNTLNCTQIKANTNVKKAPNQNQIQTCVTSNFILNFLNFDNISDSKDHSDYEYSDDDSFDYTEIYFD